MGLVGEVIKEIGNKSREFYEFVLPPVDMHLTEESLKVIADIPGFAKKDIELTLAGNILSIKASKEPQGDRGAMVCSQRPGRIDKSIRLPVDVGSGDGGIESAKYQDGVLTITIPIAKKGRNIPVE